jgi:hypothetical protein
MYRLLSPLTRLNNTGSDELDTLLPPGWTKFVHLNGGVYYSYGDSHQLLTTDDICVPSTLEKVLEAYTSATPCFQYASRRIHKLEMSVTHIDGIKHTNFASWHFCESYDYIDSSENSFVSSLNLYSSSTN